MQAVGRFSSGPAMLLPLQKLHKGFSHSDHTSHICDPDRTCYHGPCKFPLKRSLAATT